MNQFAHTEPNSKLKLEFPNFVSHGAIYDILVLLRTSHFEIDYSYEYFNGYSVICRPQLWII